MTITVADIPPRMSVNKAAQVLGLSTSTVYRLVRSGELRCNRMGGAVRIGPEHIMDYLERTECRDPKQTEDGNSGGSPTGPDGTRTGESAADLSGFRSERRMNAALDRRSRTLSAGLKIIEGEN